MAAFKRFAIVALLLLLGTVAQSVNPAYDSGVFVTTTPVFFGDVITSDFNGASGPQSAYLFFDLYSPTNYDASYVYISDSSDGLSMVSALGPAKIFTNLTIQYGSSDSTSATLDVVLNGESVASYSLPNTGSLSTYTLTSSLNATLFSGSTVQLFLQYSGTDAPQLSDFVLSIVPDPTPIYAGQALVADFNALTGPRNLFPLFDTASAAYYNTNFVSITNSTPGLTMAADIGAVMIYIQATVQYSATWSNDESSPVLVNLVVNSVSAGISPLINSGPSDTYSLYRYFNYALFNGGSLGINLQYNSAGSPQLSNLFISITPISYTSAK